MYIQIDKSVRDQLHNNVIAKLSMGSHAHGLSDDESDEDILYIYIDSNYNNNIFWESNGWQYKANDIDENYQEIRCFIRNVITSESCTDYEALMGGWEIILNNDYDGNILNELFTQLSKHRSYALIKSYLGYAKKDAKAVYKFINDNCEVTNREFCKRISHLYRGILTASGLMDNFKYMFKQGYNNHYKNLAWRIKKGECFLTIKEVEQFTGEMLKTISMIRERINKMHDSGKLVRRCETDKMKLINNYLIKLLNTYKINNNIDFGDIQYTIIEKGVSHQYVN